MAVGEVRLRERCKPTADFGKRFLNRFVPADLTGQAPLKAHPLAVDVVVALELGSVTLDTRFRLQYSS